MDSMFTMWRKATYSAANGNCIEVADSEDAVGIRDTKQCGRGPVLEFSTGAWHGFITGIKV